jgi:hypothetical protein
MAAAPGAARRAASGRMRCGRAASSAAGPGRGCSESGAKGGGRRGGKSARRESVRRRWCSERRRGRGRGREGVGEVAAKRGALGDVAEAARVEWGSGREGELEARRARLAKAAASSLRRPAVLRAVRDRERPLMLMRRRPPGCGGGDGSAACSVAAAARRHHAATSCSPARRCTALLGPRRGGEAGDGVGALHLQESVAAAACRCRTAHASPCTCTAPAPCPSGAARRQTAAASRGVDCLPAQVPRDAALPCTPTAPCRRSHRHEAPPSARRASRLPQRESSVRGRRRQPPGTSRVTAGRRRSQSGKSLIRALRHRRPLRRPAARSKQGRAV